MKYTTEKVKAEDLKIGDICLTHPLLIGIEYEETFTVNELLVKYLSKEGIFDRVIESEANLLRLAR
jgi:hypothetical protein